MARSPAQQRNTTFLALGATNSAGTPIGPKQASIGPGRDLEWDILRVWAYSIGYEPQAPDLNTGFNTNDPYQSWHGGIAFVPDGYTLYACPVAMIYHNNISLDSLIQPFRFVPRTFEPVALQQPARIGLNEKVVFFAGEFIGRNWNLGTARPGRGVALGVEYMEYS